eukprot:TRINITY_DN6362_c0_g1_i1.p1 TRINITY_DN6362_c0_g1~~TRINITY_DN6362_c0_g1_i1.p1  ORF type:complete len:158 (-),score=11.45 TRINITY_DN6362_c0_g1_i1:501-974(-)
MSSPRFNSSKSSGEISRPFTMSTDISETDMRCYSEIQKTFLNKTAVVNTDKDLDYLSHILLINVESIKCVRIAYIYEIDPIVHFITTLASNTQVQTLSFYGTEMGTRGMFALSKALMVNTSVTSLKIQQETSIAAGGWIALAESLETNSTIRKIVLI